MAGVDVDAADHAARAQFHHAMVMAAMAPPLRFPAIHVFAVGIILIGIEHGRSVRQHAALVGEELVGGVDRRASQPGGREVDGIAGEGGKRGRVSGHDGPS